MTNAANAPENLVNTEITRIIIDTLGVDETKIVDDANFLQDLGADSLDTVDLILKFEKYFGVMVSNREIEDIQTVGDAKRLFTKYLCKENKALPDNNMVITQPNNSMAANAQKIDQIFKTYPRILETVKQTSSNKVVFQKNINALFKVNLTKKDFAQVGDNYDALRTKISIAYQQTNRGK